MENNNKNNISNTMEINAILEEAKRNRSQAMNRNAVNKAQSASSQPQHRAPQTASNAPAKNVPDNANDAHVDIQNGFVQYDEPVAKKPNGKKGKKAAVIISVVAVLLVLVLAGGFCAYTFLGEFEYAKNLYINDIAIGGMTEKEVEALMTAEEQEIANGINITVNAAGKSASLSKDDFSYTFNTDEVLSEAKQYTEDNFLSNEEKRLYIAMEIDSDNLNTVVDKVAKEFKQDPENAMVTAFDSSKSGKDRFTVKDEVLGVELNKESFTQKFSEFLSQGKYIGVIDAEVTSVEPKYTKEFLLSNIKKLSSFTTVSTNNSNGNSNMALSLSQCNNSIINPGDTWSFNGCTGDSNLTSNGYKPAGVIVEGRSTTGVGGGICQSSTTIYNATMMCGMEVVERECHYYQSSYVDAGRDATVDYGNIDLKVKNIFDYQLFMECYMKGTTLYCNMYGIENPEFDEIKISSSVTSYHSRGFHAQTSRTYYLDGKKVKTESLPNSTYYTSAPGGSSSSSSSSSTTSPSQTPSTPQSPTQGGTTEDPGTDTPEDPGTNTPEDPGTDTPEVPDNPDTPVEPEVPNEPVDPVVPEDGGAE